MGGAAWPLGLYCERTALGFWAEPLNAWSNVAFLIAAWAAWRQWRIGPADPATGLLIAICVAIGFGSFAFHAAPSRTTLLMDILPIQAFVLTALFEAQRRYLGWPAWAAALGLVAFLAASAGFLRIVGASALGGGAGYLPPLAAMPLVAGLALLRARRMKVTTGAGRGAVALTEAARQLLLATAVFGISLTLRTLDRPFCGSNPFGLHFLWHGLNAVVLYLLMRTQSGFRRAAAAA
jgi:Ceramidase